MLCTVQNQMELIISTAVNLQFMKCSPLEIHFGNTLKAIAQMSDF